MRYRVAKLIPIVFGAVCSAQPPTGAWKRDLRGFESSRAYQFLAGLLFLENADAVAQVQATTNLAGA
jgi:hypothetical protein